MSNMDLPIISILIASVSTLVALTLLRPLAISVNLTDSPSGKIHDGDIPLIGGIAMFLGVLISLLTSDINLNDFKFYFLSSIVIVIVGILDDHKNIAVSLRLLFQFGVAIILVSVAGVQIVSFGNLTGNGVIFLNNWSYFISIIAFVTAMNAVNMSDGIHGLAGGSSLITSLAIIVIGNNFLSVGLLLLVFVLSTSLVVFLIHNLCIFIPKSNRVFMGDAGSMFIGLSLAYLLIELTQKNDSVISPVIALWLLATPLFEFGSVIVRRLLKGKSPFKGDLRHTHHLLMRSGFSEMQTLTFMLIISLLMAAIGILGVTFEIEEKIMLLAFLIIFVLFFLVQTFMWKRIDKLT
jgi:UDP-GlcNAc:undecaprenyl-phosphate/decaprenyl-phosphate GlcNAc-1-phosphate transferase